MRKVSLLILLSLFVGLVSASQAAAQDEEEPQQAQSETSDTEAEAQDALLQVGADVYSQTCSACHQPGGVGVAGQFPPLIDNPHVDDTVYMEGVIANGLEGELEVAGVTYDGRMPAFSTLSDEEVTAVITYIQSGFTVHTAPVVAAGVVSDSGGSGLTSGTAYIIYMIALGVGLLVLSPRIVAVCDRLTLPWLDGSAKAAVIVIWFILFTVFVPSWVLQSQTVGAWDRNLQDLIGVGLWTFGLGGGLWALWWAQREKRI